MRVTTSQTQRSQLEYIQGNLQRLVKAQEQAATGRRFQRGSEDPTATSDVLRADSTIAGLAQYRRNGDLALGRANEEDRVLSELQVIVERARELASQQSGSTASAETRVIVKAEVDQLIESAIALGNTRFNEDYLFGGTRSTQAPLANTPTSVPPYITNNAALASPKVEVSAGIVSSPNHTAHAVFRDTSLLVRLRDLSTALGANDIPGIAASIPALETSGDGLRTLQAETGARVNLYDVLRTQHTVATLDTRERRSMLYDIDIAEASANFAQAQTAYQAALSAASRVINLNVMDYLR